MALSTIAMRLTLDAVSELADGADVRKLKKFSATHKNITALDDLRCDV